MSLHFVLGPAGSGKTQFIQSEIADIIERNPEKRIFYLAPEQVTLSIQKRLLARLPQKGIMYTELLSFNRLAHRVFEETGEIDGVTLDDLGKSMLLYRLANELKDELTYYQNAVSRPGFIGQMKVMMTELYQYGLGEEEITALLEKLPEGSTLKAKWSDILLLYRRFTEQQTKGQIPSEKVLDVLASKLGQSALIKDADIYLDEYSGFTPQQLRVITGLLANAANVTVCLPMDEEAYCIAQEYGNMNMDWQELPSGLFHETQKNYLRIRKTAEALRVPRRVTVLSAPGNGEKSAGNDGISDGRTEIAALRDGLFVPVAPAFAQPAQHIFVSKFDRIQSEASALMKEILHLVREEGLRYRDIAVLSGNPEQYSRVLKRYFELYGIPCFMDYRVDISVNPLAQLAVNALKLGFREVGYEAVFGLLRTNLTPLLPVQVDEWENEVIEHNRIGWKYYLDYLNEKADWSGAAALASALTDLRAENPSGALTVEARVRALRKFIGAMRAEEKMAAAAEGLFAEKQFAAAAEYRAMPTELNTVLDTMLTLLGDVEMTAEEFYGLMQLGLSQSRVFSLPPMQDCVTVGDISRTHLSETKVLFIVGFQEENFPKETSSGKLLTDAERIETAKHIELAPGSEEQISLQYLQLYTLLGKTTGRVYFSYCEAGLDGTLLNPSYLTKRLLLLTGIGDENAQPMGWSQHNEVTLPMPYLLDNSGRLDTMPKNVRDWYVANGYADYLSRLKEAELTRVRVGELSPETVREVMDLRGKTVSISRITQYASCPYSYFLANALQLTERKLPEPQANDSGTVLHDVLKEALELFGETWKTEGKAAETALTEAIEQLFDKKKDSYSVYQTSARYRAFWKRLQESAGIALKVINEQIGRGDFLPFQEEWSFGDKGDKPYTLTLSDGSEVRLRGRIDRVDSWQNENGEQYLRVIDYKSGATSGTFDEAKVYAGLQLQLPIYLDAALDKLEAGDRSVHPAGMFYFNFTAANMEAVDGDKSAKWEARLKNQQLSGLLLNDHAVLSHMESDYGDELTLTASSKNARTDERGFEGVRKFARDKAAELVETIGKGDIQPYPVPGSRGLYCSFCDFRQSCIFDPNLPGARIHALEKPEKGFWRNYPNAEAEQDRETTPEE